MAPDKHQHKAPRRNSGGLTIVLVGTLWCLIAAVLIGGGAYLAGQWYQQQLRIQQQQLAELEAKDIASEVGTQLQAYRARADLLANDQVLVDLLQTDDDSALLQKEQQLRRQLPQVNRVKIIKAGVENLEAGDYPNLTFSDIDMLANAETSGIAPPIEVHAKGSPEQHFEVVTPIITQSKQVLGCLLLSFPATDIPTLMGTIQLPQGYAELVQHGSGQSILSLAHLGNASMKGATPAASVSIDGTRWSVEYYAMVDPKVQQSGLLYIYKGAVILALALIIISLLCARVAMAALRRKMNTIGRPVPAAATPAQRPRVSILEAHATESNIQQGSKKSTPKDPGGPPTQQQQQQQQVPRAVPASIFKAYDIRGIVGNTLTDELVQDIGRAIGSEAEQRGQQTVLVARDGRLSGAGFAAALAKGLRASGRDVIDIGRVPTPLLYFATYHLNTGSGVMVTGSHNPPDYNGFKIMLGGETLSTSAIQALRTRIEGKKFSRGAGTFKSMDIIDDYIARVTGDIKLNRPMKIVVDCGNGVAGAAAPQLLRALGCEVHELFCEVDGNFPNHHPDPGQPENLRDLIKSVKDHKADIGLAFDGDGDRLGVVDSNGGIIWPDRQMMLYATDVLSRCPGAEIIYDVKCSNHLDKVITAKGGRPLMWKTGHSLIKAKLKETGDPLAGEMSGHIFFNERWYGFDDGLYTAARLLEILAQDPRPSVEVFAALPNAINTPELNIHFAEGEHFEFMDRLMAGVHFPNARITTIDGIRADFDDGWGLVRASNTTPSLVLRFEANNTPALKRIQGIFKQAMQKIKPELEFPF
jgi:phosphomannomutase / phosphoglucomutase